MKLSREQRHRLMAGNYRPLIFDVKPYGLEQGTRYVLAWTNPKASHDHGVVSRPERRPAFWITFHKPVRRVDGTWLVKFDVHDHRERVRLLRRTPPVMTPAELAATEGLSEDEEAAEESGYTSSRWRAVDDLEAPPREWQRRVSAQAFERDHSRRLERVLEARAARFRWKRKRRAA